MERLIKSALGQWKLITESLRKDDHPLYPKIDKKPAQDSKPAVTPTNVQTSAPTPAKPAKASTDYEIDPVKWMGGRVSNIDEKNYMGRGASTKVNNDRLSAMFAEMNNHSVAGRHVEALQQKGAIKHHLLNAPRGSVDIGHLGELREAQHNDMQGKKPLSDADMAEIINHHAANIDSLKEFHKQHGDKGLRTLMRTHGVNGSSRQYSHLNLKPGVNEDLNEIIGTGFKSDEDRGSLKLPAKSEYAKTKPDPEKDKAVHQTWDDMYNDEHGSYNDIKPHENAVIERGLDHFKRHHDYK